jgi:hypothetical protein
MPTNIISLGRFFADLVLENLVEAKIRKHPRWGPIMDWVRMIYDTFLEWLHSDQDFTDFLQFLNDIHPLSNGPLKKRKMVTSFFWDVLIIRTQDSIETSVYRKPSVADRYIHYTSSQAWQEKVSAMKTLRHRAEEYCSTDQLRFTELTHLFQVFMDNGYPDHIAHRYLFQPLKTNLPNHPTDNEDNSTPSPPTNFTKSFYAPYHPSANRLFHTLRTKFNIPTIYKKTQTLESFFLKRRPPRDKLDIPGAVYLTPCSDCPRVYIGETKRSTRIRNSEEHKLCLRVDKTHKLDKSTSNDVGYASHHKETGHTINFDQTTVLEIETNHSRRKILEGLFIQNNKSLLMNLKGGTESNPIWSSLFPAIPELKVTAGAQ